MSSPKVNQQLIADTLNISRATVSRCFTNHLGINPETRSRVFKVAAKVGYNHMNARTGNGSLPTSLQRIGVMVCADPQTFGDSSYESPASKLLIGVSEYAQMHQLQLDLNYVSPAELNLQALTYQRMTGLQLRDWDAAILIYPFPAEVVEQIDSLMPLVSLVEQSTSDGINSVDANHHQGISTIVGHLASGGHRRIGFLTYTYDLEARWAQRRHAAYVEEMTRLGFAIDPEDVLNIHPSQQWENEAVNEAALQRTRAGVTAWVCAADEPAYEVIARFMEEGIRVPDDVSVTGFDGITPPKWAPALTTIAIPYREIGWHGGSRLDDLVNRRFSSPQQVGIDGLFREGQTVAPPACSELLLSHRII